MKKILAILSSVILLYACSGKKEESGVKTEKVSGAVLRSSFKVWGNCETCKETIEGSLKTEGISTADWNTETKIITVAYDSTKINLDDIEKKIAAVGYDNIKYKGNDAAYAKLPECCKYERK
ncbi:MAG TPA: heavy-metal-associated domain-containing protein [Bacteroidia bacterium]|nr:heavy-metal-associated domain-containing protein [Bacteroidia bacterium]